MKTIEAEIKSNKTTVDSFVTELLRQPVPASLKRRLSHSQSPSFNKSWDSGWNNYGKTMADDTVICETR